MAKRFEYTPISSEQRNHLALSLVDSVRDRIGRGLDVSDAQVPALNPAYARAKVQRGLKPIRDWKFTGATLDAMAPVASSDGTVQVGFNTARAEQIAAANNARARQFGASPSDQEKLVSAAMKIRDSLVGVK